MGGVEVDPDTEAARRPGPVRRRRGAPAACTAPTGSAATRCPTCWSSAGGPGCGAADVRRRARRRAPGGRRGRRRRRGRATALAPFERRGRREPVHAPPGPAADDERPGRHHPHARTSSSRRWTSSRSCKERARDGRRRGAPAVQPGLAPRARPAQHAAGLRVRRQGGAGARRRVARRPHPRRLPGHGPGVAAGRTARAARWTERRRPASRSPSEPLAGDAATDLLELFERDELAKYLTDEECERGREATMSYDGDSSGSGAATPTGGELQDYTVEVNEGEVVLDIIHRLQATQAGDLAVRWNCKAGKCGSCSAEINGRPRLMCMTRMSTFDRGRDDHRHAAADLPGDPRPGHRRLLQLREGARDPGVRAAGRRDAAASTGCSRSTSSARRSSASASSASCARTPATSIRDHEENKPAFAGPRFFIRIAELDMHPLDTARPAARSPRTSTGLGLLQHHQVLHRGLPRAHQDHRQRDHPDEGARRRPQVRPAGLGLVAVQAQPQGLPHAAGAPTQTLRLALSGSTLPADREAWPRGRRRREGHRRPPNAGNVPAPPRPAELVRGPPRLAAPEVTVTTPVLTVVPAARGHSTEAKLSTTLTRPSTSSAPA